MEQLVRDHPVSTEYQYWLAMSARDVGWAQGVMLWKPKEAEAAFISSFPLWRKLTETYPAVNAYQSELASAYAWFGLFQVYAGRGPQAAGQSREISGDLSAPDRERGGFPWNRISLALISQNAGEVLEDMGEESEAMEALRRSVVMGEKAVEGDPASTLADVPGQAPRGCRDVTGASREAGGGSENLLGSLRVATEECRGAPRRRVGPKRPRRKPFPGQSVVS